MASKVPQRGPLHFGDFERAFDELFEDLLITRWRENRPRTVVDRALVADRGPHYEVKVPTAAAEPNAVAVEVSDWRLVVRFPGSAGEIENTFDFEHPIETERVSAKWEAGILWVVLPKKRGRRVEIE